MSSTSIIGVTLLLGVIFAVLSLNTYVAKEEDTFFGYHNVLDRLRFEEYLFERDMLTNDTNHSFEIIRIAQTLNESAEIPGFVAWTDENITTNYSVTRIRNEPDFSTTYSANRTVVSTYPAKRFLETTKGISANEVAGCVCPSVNQSACNAINNTNYTWGAEICSGLPVKLNVFIHEGTKITQAFPYFLFGKTCAVVCP